jgi:2-furoyl-CoA dehydrogenase large subunit
MLAQFVGMFLGVSTESVRTRTHDIGGNFGTKTVTHPYIGLAAFASKKVGGRQVKWVESRSENLVSVQGGERTFFDTEVALDENGIILGLRSRHLDDCGAFPRYEPLGCVIWSQVYPHVYGLRNIHIDFSQVVSKKTPCVPNRGYSRFQHMWFMERVIDICAHELGLPADEIRNRNYIKPEQFPYETPNGCIYDSGNYPLMLEKAKELIDWDSWQAKKEAMTKEGRLVGIGIGTTLDSGTNNFGQSYIVNPESVFSGNSEVARVKIDLDGSIVVMLGSAPQGQGHETVAAQTVADAFGLSPDFVKVRTGFDSQWNTYNGHSGTIASQFVVTGLSAVNGACEKLITDMKRVASTVLQSDAEQLEFRVGGMGPELGVKGEPERALNFWYLSNLVNSNVGQLPEELRTIDLNVKHIYHPPVEIPDIEKKFGNLTLTYSSQLHLTVVEIDRLTCQPKILDYVVVDDCGTQINPKIVGGQVHGATAHGIGAAIQETFQYDDSGNMLTSTFTDYSPITSMNMPDIRCAAIETKSPFTFNGAKGCGEGGGAPLHTISAAVQDALYTQGIIITESHNDPSTLLDLVNNPNRETAVSVESKAKVTG